MQNKHTLVKNILSYKILCDYYYIINIPVIIEF